MARIMKTLGRRWTTGAALLAAGALGAAGSFVLGAASAEAGGGGGGGAKFQGASPGSPVGFTPIVLPAVVEGSFNEPPAGASFAFSPSFNQLTTGNTVITTEAQMQNVWRRLFFNAPYPAGSFDFESQFVVFMGAGLQHPADGFEITSVELSEAVFVDDFNTTYIRELLAVTGTEIFGGPPPPPKDFVWKVAAASINRDFLNDVLFNRDILALP